MAVGDLRIGVLTCSDSRALGQAEDEAGRAIIEACEAQDWIVAAYHVCLCEMESVCTSLIEMTDMEEVDVVLTIGGTGLGPRDIMPEATELICERIATGLAEGLRCAARESDDSWDVFLLSRATAGTRGFSLVVNLPGGTAVSGTAFAMLAPHLERAAAMVRGSE
ncbi:MogA/MoaB family molybdenum cofactor biosynthesis protein [bacterium]|nr:MogA/MoaB family molybdenum cofactor biosynthesis protein [bacterium]